MLLSSIQIQGFKSFADKTTLKFGKGVTAVVGPNGSGKSNISDAVRWVLGEQSTKSLRGQSMEDVIFSGTESRRPHGYCEVTLNINNTDRSLNFDNDFVSITRRYYRSHESEYAINHVNVRLKDIHELFMDTGLGRDGYSMIGQGKIDTIISSKSGERRDIFEEAAGISKYRYRKLEAERKLSAAEENLLRLHDIADELEARVGPLAEQSRKAQKFLELSESKKELEIGLWIYSLNSFKDALRSQESKIAAAQETYRELEEELSEFERKSETNTAYFASLTSEIEGERLFIASANEEIARKNGEITVLNNDIAHNKDSINRLIAESEQLNRSDLDAKSEMKNKTREAEERERQKKEIEEGLAALEAQLTDLLSDSESISRKIETQARTLNELTAQSADRRVEMVTADSAIEEITARAGVSEELAQKRHEEIEGLNREFSETQEMIRRTEEQQEAAQNALKGYEMRLASKEASESKLKEQLDTVRLDTEEKKRRIGILKDLENNMEGFSRSVKVVMNDAKIGILRGIDGPVSKIITVPKKYTVAVETALGNAIQNIVVETENDAKRAIGHLKKNNSGRATFLPISSIKARELKEHGFEELPGYVGIAADLVETDSKYREIVRYLLGGALVAEDLDSAAAIAKKFGYRIKVVSLDGQVLNPGGSMTGGSLVKNAGLLSRSADIARLENDVRQLTRTETELSDAYTAAAQAVAACRADIASVTAELATANEDKILALAELKRIDGLRDSLTESLKQLHAEQEESENKVKALRGASEAAAKEITQLEVQKTEIQAEIDKMTGGRENLNETRERLLSSITAAKLSVIEAQKDQEAILLAVRNLQEAITGRVSRLDAIQSEISGYEQKNQELSHTISEIENQIAGQKEAIVRAEQAITERIEKRGQTEKAGVELRAAEREKSAHRERIGGDLARLTERKDVMMREYDDVVRRLYDEYQLTRSEAERIGIKIEKPAEAKKNLAEIKAKIRALGTVNVSAIEEYEQVNERYRFLSDQIGDVKTSRDELYKLISQLTVQMQEIFIDGFRKINENFSKTFTELFGGGSAELSLTDPENILESGIDIHVKLPGKNVPSLDGLSGGEKALIALSIYFAIMRVNAPPFCFLDEVDTALDDINVERFAEYMKRSDYATQFICVTHRRGTMEAADMLYGVTMQEKGVTKLLELNVSELEKKLPGHKGA